MKPHQLDNVLRCNDINPYDADTTHTMLNETTPPRPALTMRQWASNLFRLAADALAPSAAIRPTIDAIRSNQAYDVEVALLDAEEAEERAVFTTMMLRQRLRRLQHGEDHPSSGVPAGSGHRAPHGELPDLRADKRITPRVYDATKEIGRKAL